jgi:hypothetical protein
VRSGLAILIIGAGLLVLGLIIAGISVFTVTKEVLEGSTIIDKTSIQPSLSYVAVMKDVPAGQQLLLSLSSDPSDVPVQAKITESDGTVLVSYNITESPFTSTTVTKTTGDQTLEIKNMGTRAVTVSGGVINAPLAQQSGGLSVQDNPSVQTFVSYGLAILAGIALIIAGIVLLIIGAIKYVRAG